MTEETTKQRIHKLLAVSVGKFKVGHLNGQGLVSSGYYIDEENLPTLVAAKKRAQEIRAQNPERDGWYKIVSVLDEEDTPVWSPDFD